MTQQQLIDFATKKYARCVEIMKAKNHDYSYGEEALSNFKAVELFGVRTEDGFLTRLMDKLKRISNLTRYTAAVLDEKIEDTILDAINYLMLLLAYLEEKHDKQEDQK
jgi:hypothetical protein